MALINYAKREIDAKVVYYGPALCGKTTNLQFIHKKLSPSNRGKLVSLATDADRTLFFDFLPIELPDVMGFKTRFHAYTVPGQVYYAATRKAVLSGVDGVVFVADSQNSKLKENIESLKDLEQNLRAHGKTLKTLPFVIQYNKRDLPNIMEVPELDGILNKMNAPTTEAVAYDGRGVMETLTAICKQVLKELEKGSRTARRPARVAAKPAEAAAPKSVEDILQPPEPTPPPPAPEMEAPLMPEPTPAPTPSAAPPPPSEEEFSFSDADSELDLPSPSVAAPKPFLDEADLPPARPVPAMEFSGGADEEIEVLGCGDPEVMGSVIKIPINLRFTGRNQDFTLNISIRVDQILSAKDQH